MTLYVVILVIANFSVNGCKCFFVNFFVHLKKVDETMKKLPQAMNLIKVVPTSYDYLDSDLKKDGFGNRQHLEF